MRQSLLRLLRGEDVRTCTSSTLRVRASGAERIVVDESGEVHYTKSDLDDLPYLSLDAKEQ